MRRNKNQHEVAEAQMAELSDVIEEEARLTWLNCLPVRMVGNIEDAIQAAKMEAWKYILKHDGKPIDRGHLRGLVGNRLREDSLDYSILGLPCGRRGRRAWNSDFELPGGLKLASVIFPKTGRRMDLTVTDEGGANPENAKVAEAVASALKKLRPNHAWILKVRYGLDGYGVRTLPEIAEAMGTKRWNAWDQLRIAKGKLKEKLEEEGMLEWL